MFPTERPRAKRKPIKRVWPRAGAAFSVSAVSQLPLSDCTYTQRITPTLALRARHRPHPHFSRTSVDAATRLRRRELSSIGTQLIARALMRGLHHPLVEAPRRRRCIAVLNFHRSCIPSPHVDAGCVPRERLALFECRGGAVAAGHKVDRPNAGKLCGARRVIDEQRSVLGDADTQHPWLTRGLVIPCGPARLCEAWRDARGLACDCLRIAHAKMHTELGSVCA